MDLVKHMKEMVRPPHLKVNFEEELVPEYTLPDPLKFENGQRVTNENWDKRRNEIIELFREYSYGNKPNLDPNFETKIIREVKLPGNTGAIRRDLELIFCEGKYKVPALLFLPDPSNKPVPVFVGLNFQGNHTVHNDPTIDLPEGYVGDRPDLGSNGNKASECSRGIHAACWPVEMITSRGYAVITAQHSAFAPDNVDLFDTGIQQFEKTERNDQSARAISIWAWGLSKLREALIPFKEIDENRASTIGHSRLGKTALWAGAEYPEFAMAVSLQSGQSGASLSRRCYGERIVHGAEHFPYWYTPKYKTFSHKENEFPVDQHQLLSLIAPRPLYIASAKDDIWCDPKGEFLSALHASPVFEFLGKEGINQKDLPELNKSVGKQIGYHLRAGTHQVLPADWWHILNFADKNL